MDTAHDLQRWSVSEGGLETPPAARITGLSPGIIPGQNPCGVLAGWVNQGEPRRIGVAWATQLRKGAEA